MMKRLLLTLVIGGLLAACAPPPPTAAPTPAPATEAATEAAKPTSPPVPDLSAIEGETALLVTWQEKGGFLRPIDLATGAEIEGVTPIGMGMYSNTVGIPGTGKIAAMVYSNNGVPTSGKLKIIDTTSWTTQDVDFKIRGWVNKMVVSPDGRWLAVGSDSGTSYSTPQQWDLALVDLDTLATVASVKLDTAVREMAFSEDGKTLALYSMTIDTGSGLPPEKNQIPGPMAMLLDGQTLATVWETGLPMRDGQYRVVDGDLPDSMPFESWQSAAAFSADHTKLYIVHANSDNLTTVDFAAQTVSTTDVAVARSWLDNLMAFGAKTAHAKVMKGTFLSGTISADGSRMYVVGMHYDVEKKSDKSNDFEFIQEPTGLRVIELASGHIVGQLDTKSDQITLSADGSQLYLYGYSESGTAWTKILDAQSLEVLAEFDTFRVTPVMIGGREWMLGMQSPNGTRTVLSVIDPATFREITQYTIKGGWSDLLQLP